MPFQKSSMRKQTAPSNYRSPARAWRAARCAAAPPQREHPRHPTAAAQLKTCAEAQTPSKRSWPLDRSWPPSACARSQAARLAIARSSGGYRSGLSPNGSASARAMRTPSNVSSSTSNEAASLPGEPEGETRSQTVKKSRVGWVGGRPKERNRTSK
jgi:hypothetical protein